MGFLVRSWKFCSFLAVFGGPPGSGYGEVDGMMGGEGCIKTIPTRNNARVFFHLRSS
jgi:hypothetical protein